MYYHLVMHLFKGIDKENSLPEEECIEEGRSHIHTPFLIHSFNKLFIAFLLIDRHVVALIQCSISKNNGNVEKGRMHIYMYLFIHSI